MQMRIDGKWVDAADGDVNEILDNATGGLIETAPRGSALDVTCANEAALRGRRAMAGTKMGRNAREGLHETLLDMTEQKALLMSGVFSA